VLAAGRSTRMGGPNKLLAELDGKKLVRTVAEQALASKATDVIVVTGHQADLVEQALAGLNVKFVRNPDFAGGLASSVKAGIAAVAANADGALVCLGDMPLIDAKLIDRLIEAFEPDRGHLIAVPVSDGRRGNPVLWSRRFFRELMTLDGDVGARHLIAKHAEATLVEVELTADAGGLELVVRDDGIGFDPLRARRGEASGHFGLRGLHERAAQVGGAMQIDSIEGEGTTIRWTATRQPIPA